MKILIVDDEETARYGMRRALDVKGRVFEAGNLTAARRICLEEKPDLVLLDLNLGGESGLDLLTDLQSCVRGIRSKVHHHNGPRQRESRRRGDEEGSFRLPRQAFRHR